MPASFFDRFGNAVISIVGSGGKTSLLWSLAARRRAQSRVLVTTTTRIQLPDAAAGLYDNLLLFNGGEASPLAPHLRCCAAPLPKGANAPLKSPAGVTLAGRVTQNDAGMAKFCAPPDDALKELIPRYDYVFIESDGSRTLPLKGWADYEPVVPEETTVTVGIMPLWTLGLAADESIIHRLPLWTELTGAKKGDIITLNHLERAISGGDRRGIFAAAHGVKVLFFNQVEDKSAFSAALAISKMLKSNHSSSCVPDFIIAGSIKHAQYNELS